MNAIDEFIERLKPLEDLWPHGDLRYSAFKQDGEWRNIATQLTLRWTTPPEMVVPKLRHDRFVAGRTVLSPESVVETIRSAGNGDFTVDGHRIRLDYLQTSSGGARNIVKSSSWSQYYLGANWRLQAIYQGSPETLLGYALLTMGGQIQEIIDAESWAGIRHALLLGEPPYAGFEDLSSNFLTTSEPLGWNWPTRFQCTAPLGTQFEDWEIGKGVLTGKLHVPPNVKPEDLRITAIFRTQDQIDRTTVRPGALEPNPYPELRSAPFSVPFQTFGWADLHLLLRGIEVDRLRIALPTAGTFNPRLKALDALDRVPVLLNQIMDSAPTFHSTDALETLVSWILHLCGFQVMGVDTGSMRGRAGLVCDFIAFDPYSNEAAVLDVTASEPMNNEKLVKVRVRTETVQAKLPDVKVRAVIVVPGRDSFLPEEVEAAKAVSIRLVSRADLREMVESAERNEMPSAIAQRFFEPA